MSAKFYIWGGGRWRAVDSKTGVVDGWGRARFVTARRGRLRVTSRRAVLAALRAHAACLPSVVRLGPRLTLLRNEPAPSATPVAPPVAPPTVPPPAPPAVPPAQAPSGCHHCCRYFHGCHTNNLDTAARPPPAARDVTARDVTARRDVGVQHAPRAPLSPPLHALLSPARGKRRRSDTSRTSLSSGGDFQRPSKARRPATQSVARSEPSEERDSDSLCKELTVSESDVLALRSYVARARGDALERFDTDDGYKRLLFYAINPLVALERSARADRLALPHFAARLGLAPRPPPAAHPASDQDKENISIRKVTPRTRHNTHHTTDKSNYNKLSKSNDKYRDEIVKKSVDQSSTGDSSEQSNWSARRRRDEDKRVVDRTHSSRLRSQSKVGYTETDKTRLILPKINDKKHKSAHSGDPELTTSTPESSSTDESASAEEFVTRRKSARLSVPARRTSSAERLSDTNSSHSSKENKRRPVPNPSKKRAANSDGPGENSFQKNIGLRTKTTQNSVKSAPKPTLSGSVDSAPARGDASTAHAVLKPLRVAMDSHTISKRASSSHTKEYSNLEDHAVVAWVSSGARARRVNGNALWRELQDQYPALTGVRRSWHSLRNRYLRYILPALGALRLEPQLAARLRAAASVGENKRRGASRRNSIFDQSETRSASARRPPRPRASPAPPPAPAPRSPDDARPEERKRRSLRLAPSGDAEGTSAAAPVKHSRKLFNPKLVL